MATTATNTKSTISEVSKDPDVEKYWASSDSVDWSPSPSLRPAKPRNQSRRVKAKTKDEVQIVPVLPNQEEQMQSSITMSDIYDSSRKRVPTLRLAGYVIDREPDHVIIDRYGRYHRAESTVKSKWE